MADYARILLENMHYLISMPYTMDSILFTPGRPQPSSSPQTSCAHATSCLRCHTSPCIPYITTTTVLKYITCSMKSSTFAMPETPIQPFFNDTRNATRFSRSLQSLASLQHKINILQSMDME
ncbi:hypothetical protein SELMODRAFT_404780 [Selaginella moellendorffii]|uniref:Uncharacterized protein n=1 Tax=Selaginella moellendorffii TaxID=88036 RepID=D8QXB8_SELML|nr:hypothetical protein SELMODRAFT_404780 [Selaginella moellendorffii]